MGRASGADEEKDARGDDCVRMARSVAWPDESVPFDFGDPKSNGQILETSLENFREIQIFSVPFHGTYPVKTCISDLKCFTIITC